MDITGGARKAYSQSICNFKILVKPQYEGFLQMLDGFRFEKLKVSTGIQIAYHIGGSGHPLLLLHGYPQTHLMWAKIAPRLAEHFTVVMSDLRGYGDSDKPKSDPRHVTYSFRAMASDQIGLMDSLGHKQFAVAGHDRGARVAHRMCLDQPERVTKAAVLDIVPTLTLYERTDMAFAMGYYEWFLLPQPEPFPEELIGANPNFFIRYELLGWSKDKESEISSIFNPECLAEYERCFCDPLTIHSTCEDYRAAASIDLEHDRADREAGRKIQCPLLVLWGDANLVLRNYDILDTWRKVSDNSVEGNVLNCGHYLPEEAPKEVIEEFKSFFKS
jgi:haloacetate dehalogenase